MQTPMFDASEFRKAVRRPYPPLYSSMLMEGTDTAKFYKHFAATEYHIKRLICTPKHVWYYDLQTYEEGKELLGTAWLNPETFERKKRIIRQREQKLEKAPKTTLTDFFEAYTAYASSIMIVYLGEEKIERILRKELEEVLPEQTEELMDVLNIPLENNYYKQEEYDLVATSNLEAHRKKYKWLHSRYGQEIELTLEELKERKAGIDSEKFLHEWKKNKQRVKNAIAKAKKALKNQVHIVDALQYHVFYRTHRTDTLNKNAFLAIPLLKKFSLENKLSYKQLLHCKKDEILNTIPSQDTLNERMQKHAMVLTDGKIHCYTGAVADEIEKDFTEKHTGASSFSGRCACKGDVEGTVRIVHDKGDFKNFLEGEILVAAMTTPDMLPIMKKAIGIVTDEGGVTCHAAIISRELGIPCVIGTQVATQALNSGDTIMLNAEATEVKILKRHKKKK